MRSEKLTSRISVPRLRFLTSSTISDLEWSGIAGRSSDSVRPTIMAMIFSTGVVSAGTVSIYSPSRMTVTRSAMRFSSSILCEM